MFYILEVMKKKVVTIEHLARMIKKGFDETASKVDVMATRTEMRKGFAEVYKRLDRIENLILADHRRRIERLETEMQELKGLLAIH